MASRKSLLAWLILSVVMGTFSPRLLCAQDEPLRTRVDTLIQQLGAESYRERERAEAELQQLGLIAFEPLQEVRNHPDIEIRLRARAIVAKLRKFFLSEGIDPVMGRLLSRYEGRPEEERRQRIRYIAALLPQQGMEALCRVARFEDSELLAKQAALGILESAIEVREKDRITWLGQVVEAAAISRREATTWLHCFASVGTAPEASSRQWEQLIAAEEARHAALSPDTDSDIVLRLRRLQTDLLQFAGIDNSLRTDFVSRAFDSEQAAREWLFWLQERGAWAAIVAMAAASENLLENDRVLLYGLAEAQLELGETAAASRSAEKAFRQGGSSNGNQHDRRLLAAFLEDERGRFDWAEREYRAAFSEAKTEGTLQRLLGERNHERYRTLFPLSEMLHDAQRDLEAAQVLQQYIEDAETDPTLKNASDLGRDYANILSRMHFFFAEHYRAEEQLEKQKEHLELGFEANPEDADLLIAMYRFAPADDAWKNKVNRAIMATADNQRREISELQITPESLGVDRDRLLAYALNQFAWLVGNTMGDGQQALRYSQHSLELQPGDAGFLDTLARCYFNVGEIDKAIHYQTWAVQRSPHERQLVRQLEFFQQQAQSNP